MDAVHAADAVLRPKSPGAESTKSTDSFREQRLTTIKMAASHPSGSLGSAASAASTAAPPPPPPQTSTVRNEERHQENQVSFSRENKKKRIETTNQKGHMISPF